MIIVSNDKIPYSLDLMSRLYTRIYVYIGLFIYLFMFKARAFCMVPPATVLLPTLLFRPQCGETYGVVLMSLSVNFSP